MTARLMIRLSYPPLASSPEHGATSSGMTGNGVLVLTDSEMSTVESGAFKVSQLQLQSY